MHNRVRLPGNQVQWYPALVSYTHLGREYEQFMKEIRQLRGQVAAREVKPDDYLARRTAILFNNVFHVRFCFWRSMLHEFS